MERINHKIKDLIQQYPKAAKALHFLGIHFYNYDENTLSEICRERDLDPAKVIQQLDAEPGNSLKPFLNWNAYPLDLIIAYLKHSHYIFIKDRLNYLNQLLANYSGEGGEDLEELQTVFPHFSEEFIEHVYEEEDTLFAYISTLLRFKEGEGLSEKDQERLKAYSLEHMAQEHQHQDQEIESIQRLIQNYQSASPGDVHAQIIMKTLREFAEELSHHARIENEILFPKAIVLEKQVKSSPTMA